MRVLVLGGTRFIGRAIVDALLPRHEVTVLNRGHQPLWDERIVQLLADRGELGELASALTEPFDCVVDVSGTEPAYVRNVLYVLDKTPYVFVSSAAVYERAKMRPPFGEDDPGGGDPIWGGYGEAKAACEQTLRHTLGDEVTILRPPYVYGPRNNEQREQFLWARILDRQPVFVPGDGSTTIQFCHVDALSRAVVAVCDGELMAGTYNVGESRTYTFSDYLRLLGTVAGVEPVLCEVTNKSVPARSYFPFRPADLTLQVGKLAATGVVPDIPLADGLAETFAWFDENGGFEYTPTPQEHLWRHRRTGI
ncbi:NAD-dependent epimerase/dehydratase family protein [Kribbella sp. NPDC050241]|uniref:NAD-dependent epimerase/dehydratase family protein n=1 Tax=Kribbella sp. NPDC050241 TaxID=3364115 RepID=UPI0037986393